MILSVGMMLGWLGEFHRQPALERAAAAIDAAVDAVLADPATRTRDIGGTIGCNAFGDAVAKRLN
jgi:3-isopropylmalate dehydrogenase